jgi:hypothetical protein
MARDPERARFKTDINLTEYAASRDYALVLRETSRNSVAMRHPDGDKITIAREDDGNWIYFSIHSRHDLLFESDNLDYVRNTPGTA